MSKPIRVKVFLNNLAPKLEEWNKRWEEGYSNDPFPYGFNWANSPEVKVEYIGTKNISNKLLYKLYQLFVLPFKLFGADIVWTHYDIDAFLIAFLRKIPILNLFLPKQLSCFIWLIDRSKDFSEKRLQFTRWLIKNIDYIVYLAPTEREYFINTFHFSADKQQFIPFAINTECYEKGEREQVTGIDFPYLLSVGNDVHRDIDLLIEIANELEGKIKVVFASNNPEFKEKAKTCSNLYVVTGNLKQIRWLYEQCLFAILPLKYNEHVSGCTTILEAGAIKKTIIVTEIPGIEAYLQDGVTGLLTREGNLQEFIEKINSLIDNPSIREDLGEKAYTYVTTYHTTRQWANEHAKISKHLLMMK